MRKIDSEEGFTLIEYVIATVIFAIVMVMVISLYVNFNHAIVRNQETRDIQNEVRNVIDTVTRVATNAVYVEVNDKDSGGADIPSYCDNTSSLGGNYFAHSIGFYSKYGLPAPDYVFNYDPATKVLNLNRYEVDGTTLTTDRVTAFDVTSFRACYRNNIPTIVDFDFTIKGPQEMNGIFESNEVSSHTSAALRRQTDG